MEGILAGLNTRVLKEPRGFMKILEFIFSICAFATTTSFSSYFSFKMYCVPDDEKANVTFTEDIVYPFQLDRIRTPYNACGFEQQHLYVEGDFSSDARFYVAVGVLALLYVLVALGLYCFFSTLYESKDLVPIGDFMIHVVFVLLWFAASCAWAKSLSDMRTAASLDNIIRVNDMCTRTTCRKVDEARFGQLISSVIFGFLNVFLWASNLWFLYKETPVYKNRKATEATGNSN